MAGIKGLGLDETYNGSDFAAHYMRKNKSGLNNIFYIAKGVRHAIQQEKYRKKKWKNKNKEK